MGTLAGLDPVGTMATLVRCLRDPAEVMPVRDQERQAKFAELQALVTEGIESGVSTRTKDDIRRLSRETAAARKA